MPVAKGVRSNHLPEQNCINYNINNKTAKMLPPKVTFGIKMHRIIFAARALSQTHLT